LANQKDFHLVIPTCLWKSKHATSRFIFIEMDKINLRIYFLEYILTLMVIAKAYWWLFTFQANASNSCCKTHGTNCLTQIILIWADMDKHQCFGIASCQCEKNQDELRDMGL
jgi:hypothetical protein